MTGAPLRFHNTLSGRKEDFTPLEPGRVKMYVCGITPYDECHLGHARVYVLFDTIRRFLQTSGYQVRYIQNFTDIDDKIIQRAAKLGQKPEDVAGRNIDDYFAKMRLLNIQEADAYPRVTQTIPEILAFIQRILDKGYAYPVGGDVYFSVRKLAGYGKLSKRSLDELESGARVEVDERKQDPLDFALWKAAKPGEPAWDSPWGKGRPGWHIECSVMSTLHLGETFDIHGGGQDLIFPHHENEIAQSEGATGKPFARYWIHNGFVTVNREKMSKSLGNFFTLREILEKYPPEVVRFFLLSRHYHTPLDFSDDLLNQARSAYYSLQDTDDVAAFLEEAPSRETLAEVEKQFRDAMADDFNTEKAIGILFQLRNQMVEKINKKEIAWLAPARQTLERLVREILGIPLKPSIGPDVMPALKAKISERALCRQKKDWAGSDKIRNEIDTMGFLIEDTPAGAAVKTKRL